MICSTESNLEFDAYQSRRRFSNLDGLRFFCIAGVVWHHVPHYSELAHPARILQRGFLGVDFFFVLSGFLITSLLLREEQRCGGFSLAAFYRRRLLRIVPVYLFVVSLVSAYYVLIQGETQYAALLPFYYLFLSNLLTDHIPRLGLTWSLAVEFHYYLAWPVLLLFVRRTLVVPLLIGLSFLSVLGAMGWVQGLGIRAFSVGFLQFKQPYTTYVPILMGSVVAMLMHQRRGFAILLRLFGHKAASVVAFAVFLIAIQLLPSNLRGLPNLAIHLLMSACLVTIVIRDQNPLSPILTWWPVARIGEISYGIYLYHLIALVVATAVLTRLSCDNTAIVLLLYFTLSIVISEISFRTLEKVFRQFR